MKLKTKKINLKVSVWDFFKYPLEIFVSNASKFLFVK